MLTRLHPCVLLPEHCRWFIFNCQTEISKFPRLLTPVIVSCMIDGVICMINEIAGIIKTCLPALQWWLSDICGIGLKSSKEIRGQGMLMPGVR